MIRARIGEGRERAKAQGMRMGRGTYFEEEVAPGMSRFDKFQNELDEYYLRELLTRMEIFRDELAFVLNNTDIPKDKPFEFLKRLSAAIYSMKDVTLGYDESKPLAGFLWNVFAGWEDDEMHGHQKVPQRFRVAL